MTVFYISRPRRSSEAAQLPQGAAKDYGRET